MSSLATCLTILRHSLHTIRQHPVLLLFPLVSLLISVVLFDHFLSPQLFGVSAIEYWNSLSGTAETREAVAEAIRNSNMSTGHFWRGLSILDLLVVYIGSMFIATFINVALYSQIIEAMNGGKISIKRGIAVAWLRLPAIAAWTLVAGTIGVVLRLLQERLAIPVKWIAALTGVTWTAASVFVIPVMINEPRSRTPFQYLGISAALLKRVWGEGLIALNGLLLGGFIIAAVLMFIVVGLSTVTINPFLASILVYVISLALFMLGYLIYQVFECGLYVYATQGVAPGSFDEATFERAWTVRPLQADTGDDGQPARRSAWRVLLILLPAAAAITPTALRFFGLGYERVAHPQQRVASALVDLKHLDRRVTIEDLHAAGLFLGRRCSKCGKGTRKSPVMLNGKEEDGLQATLYEDDTGMYLHFYGPDAASGRTRVHRSLEALRSRFPGSKDSINLLTSFDAKWPAVPGAVNYRMEIECLDPPESGSACQRSDLYVNQRSVREVRETTVSMGWVGEWRGRWRVSPVYDGSIGPPSEWTEFTPTP